MKLTNIESILERSGFKRYSFGDYPSYESSFCGVALIEDSDVVQIYLTRSTGTNFNSTEIPVELIKTFKATPKELEVTFGSRGYILYQR